MRTARALCLVVLTFSTISVPVAASERFAAAGRRPFQSTPLSTRLLIPAELPPLDTVPGKGSGSAQQAAAKRCRPGRRAWMGAIIGGAAITPVAVLVHERWENEAANGGGAAATTIAIGSAAGALVGLATCR